MNKITHKINLKKAATLITALLLLIIAGYLYQTNHNSRTEQQSKISVAKAEELLNQANTLITQKKYPESIELLRQAQNVYPNNYDYNFKLGLAYYLNKDYESAVKYINQSLPLASNDSFKSNAYNVLGNAYRDKNDMEKAADSYLKSIELNPKDQNPYLNLSRLYIQENNSSEAKQIIERGITNIPDSAALKQALNNIK